MGRELKQEMQDKSWGRKVLGGWRQGMGGSERDAC